MVVSAYSGLIRDYLHGLVARHGLTSSVCPADVQVLTLSIKAELQNIDTLSVPEGHTFCISVSYNNWMS